MRTPICDFARDYEMRAPLRLHMPGHKGMGATGVETVDITEIEGADALYAPEGIIRESQENASRLFGSAATLYSTEGSSLSIRAMLYLSLLWGKTQGRAPRILAVRNVHRSFVSAAALLGLEVEWLYSEQNQLLCCPITPDQVERTLTAADSLPIALYLTSPDYPGNIADVSALAEVCHRHGILLLVDNAHGAYLRFLPKSQHPLSLGADACCDSAHKTLPALTGAGYLHISHTAPAIFSEQATRAMALFASTSPSYLILQSLDRLNPYLAGEYPRRLADFAQKVEELKYRLTEAGFSPSGGEPLKLTVFPKTLGYTGTDLVARLAEKNIVCEFGDPDLAVMMLTPEMKGADLIRLEQALLELPHRKPILDSAPPLPHPQRVISLRDAMLSAGATRAVEDSVGRIFADATLSCPPAVPILVCGERIDEDAVACFRYYGITQIQVIDT